MATRTDIGKVRSAVQEGRLAYSALDLGPKIPSGVTSDELASADWGAQFIDPKVFIAGVHKWGDTTLRVAK